MFFNKINLKPYKIRYRLLPLISCHCQDTINCIIHQYLCNTIPDIVYPPQTHLSRTNTSFLFYVRTLIFIPLFYLIFLTLCHYNSCITVLTLCQHSVEIYPISLGHANFFFCISAPPKIPHRLHDYPFFEYIVVRMRIVKSKVFYRS